MLNSFKKSFLWLCKGNADRIAFILLVALGLAGLAEAAVKSSDLAGSWYSQDPVGLKKDIDQYLYNAERPKLDGDVLGLIVPHAGLAYSGQTAAYAFKVLTKENISTVIVVGFSHRKNYDAIAVFGAEGVKTPLGVLYTDSEIAGELIAFNEKIIRDDRAFDNENSVEMILPFIQTALGDKKIVSLAIGAQSYENSLILAEALYEVIKERNDIVIVASTDMSHYLPLVLAEKTDNLTLSLIKDMDPYKLHMRCIGQNRMCGTAAVSAVMIASKKLGADQVKILHQSTSAQNEDPNEKVVGYLSAAFVRSKNVNNKEEKNMAGIVTEQEKKDLLHISRETLAAYVKENRVLHRKNDNPSFDEVSGLFVTLHKNGSLRGCIGNIIGTLPIYQGVIDMTIAASSQDPRFSAVSENELAEIDIEISLLTPLAKIDDPDKIIMGKHGVLVKDRSRSGVYLPQVAIETGWSRDEFMNSLCGQKAGMRPDAWRMSKCEIYIFSAEVFGEKDFLD